MYAKKYFKKAMLFCLITVVAAATLAAWDWPVKDPVLSGDFASDLHNSFLAGVYLKTTEALVRSVHGGELVYYAAGPRRDHRGFPGARGGTLVIGHANGFRSIYHGLIYESVRDFANKVQLNQFKVKQNEIIGMLPLKSDNSPDNLFFQMIDNRFPGAVNPMVLLPRLPDDRPPAIASVEIASEGQARAPIRDRSELASGKFQLYIQVRDGYGTRARKTADIIGLPQDIKVFLNGVVKYESSKQTLFMQPNNSRELILAINPLGGFMALHAADSYIFAGDYVLADGVNRLEIRVSDLQGNRSGASYRLIKPGKSTGS